MFSYHYLILSSCGRSTYLSLYCFDKGAWRLLTSRFLISFVKEGLDVMLNVPKSANDNMHLRMLRGVEVSV